jgi:hypothetical protein
VSLWPVPDHAPRGLRTRLREPDAVPGAAPWPAPGGPGPVLRLLLPVELVAAYRDGRQQQHGRCWVPTGGAYTAAAPTRTPGDVTRRYLLTKAATTP